MSITVVGSIAFDAVETPFGVRERMLGGAATHFALAASLFDRVHIVGPVGDDFGEEEMAVLATRGTVDRRRRAGRRRQDLLLEGQVRLGPQHPRDARHPAQRVRALPAQAVGGLAGVRGPVPGQHPAGPAAPGPRAVRRRQVRRAGLDEPVDRHRPRRAGGDHLPVDCLILNDEELRQLTGKPNLISAAREVLTLGPSPSIVVAKQGEYGSALITGDSFFALPAYPLEEVIDPTGAGDTFAGGFVGYIAPRSSTARAALGEVLRNAMAYGTALASFNVERFGTEGVHDVTAAAVRERVEDLVALRPLRPRGRGARTTSGGRDPARRPRRRGGAARAAAAGADRRAGRVRVLGRGRGRASGVLLVRAGRGRGDLRRRRRRALGGDGRRALV